MSAENIGEKQFWDWFVENKKGLEDFINSGQSDYNLYNLLTEKLKAYNERQINVLPIFLNGIANARASVPAIKLRELN